MSGNTASPEKSLVEIAAAMTAGEYDRASRLADSILAQGLHHPIVYNARALAFQARGRFREALGEFDRARMLAPEDSNLVNAIGICLNNLNRPGEAIRAFDRAIALDPKNAQPHFRKAWILDMLGDRDDAITEYERAVEIDPRHADALAGLAAELANAGKIEVARVLAQRALAIETDQPTALAALAIVDMAGGNFVGAEARLRNVLNSARLTMRAHAIVHALLADALDGQDRTDEAFELFRFANNEIYKLYAKSYLVADRGREIAERIALFLEGLPPVACSQTLAAAPVPGAPKCHAFLVGFSRSGTTLLEQVLASHPDVAALEERDLLSEPAKAFLSGDSAMRHLASAGEATLAPYRDAYWRAVREAGLSVGNKVFIDKLPLNTVKLPLIAKLFPAAKIIFALRDPRDVVLSCYRRQFEINASMFEFLRLEDCAEFYASVMRIGALSREKLALQVHEHRYEDMVADFDSSIAAICAFLEIIPSGEMRDFYVKELLAVRSPSAAQIRRPLYRDAVSRWRRYRRHLAPVLPLLMPWVERFGYPLQ